MKDFILLIAFIAMLGFCYYVVKRIDIFIDRILFFHDDEDYFIIEEKDISNEKHND